MTVSGVLRQRQHTGEWVDRGWYLVTEFEQSSSLNFQKTVELAQTHPGFIQLMDERNIVIYRNMYREHDVRQFQELYALIKNWKGTRLYFKGDETPYETIENGVRCYIRTKLDVSPVDETHVQQDEAVDGCKTFTPHRLETAESLGYIGCHRSRMSMEWQLGPENDALPWFFYGRLDRHRVYNLDKEEIQRFTSGHLALYSSCPLLHLDQIAEFIDHLPERIDPRKDREWNYRKSESHDLSNRFYRMPEVLPKSPEAYRMYLKRIL